MHTTLRQLTTPARRNGLRRFVTNVFAYSGSNFASQAAGILQKYLVRGILPPAAMGWWELATVVQSFLSSVNPGLEGAAGVELPVLDGQRNDAEQIRVRSTLLVTHVLMGVAMSAAILSYAIWQRAAIVPENFWALITGAALVLIAASSDSLTVFHQGRQTFGALGRAAFASAITTAVLLPAGAWLGGLKGLFIGGVAAYGLRSLFLYVATRHAGIELNLQWTKSTFVRLIKFGAPLRVVEYPATLFTFLDIFVVTRYLGTSGLAIYTTARVVVLQAANIPAFIGSVLIMRLFHLSGRQSSRTQLCAELKTFLLAQYLVLNPVVTCIIAVAFAFLTKRLIPEYSGSVPVLCTLICCLYFLPQCSLVRNIWMLDRRLPAIAASNIAGLISIGLCLLIVPGHPSLENVAIAMVCGYALYHAYLMATVGREIWGAGAAVVWLSAVAGAVTTRLALTCLDVPLTKGVLPFDLDEVALVLAKALAVVTPLVVFGMWRLNLLSLANQMITERRVNRLAATQAVDAP